jgi:hypothetical protein
MLAINNNFNLLLAILSYNAAVSVLKDRHAMTPLHATIKVTSWALGLALLGPALGPALELTHWELCWCTLGLALGLAWSLAGNSFHDLATKS